MFGLRFEFFFGLGSNSEGKNADAANIHNTVHISRIGVGSKKLENEKAIQTQTLEHCIDFQ